ncbi:putative lrr receptor-like serine/threonine-protein kinase [Quercus suber]|uniref:Lrr receptor-like serine/threonine-protein kinase n=1 Tax=Quercus suber TaxID=58331 RepID=A0AAW0KB79_QUESU
MSIRTKTKTKRKKKKKTIFELACQMRKLIHGHYVCCWRFSGHRQRSPAKSESILRRKSEKNKQQRKYSREWNKQSNNPCEWPGINCSTTTRIARVTSINLSDNEISGKLFGNFSLLTELSFLDLSRNTLSGVIPEDLNRCQNLVHLNLSHNMLDGHLNLTGLNKLEKLDISVNKKKKKKKKKKAKTEKQREIHIGNPDLRF